MRVKSIPPSIALAFIVGRGGLLRVAPSFFQNKKNKKGCIFFLKIFVK